MKKIKIAILIIILLVVSMLNVVAVNENFVYVIFQSAEQEYIALEKGDFLSFRSAFSYFDYEWLPDALEITHLGYGGTIVTMDDYIDAFVAFPNKQLSELILLANTASLLPLELQTVVIIDGSLYLQPFIEEAFFQVLEIY